MSGKRHTKQPPSQDRLRSLVFTRRKMLIGASSTAFGLFIGSSLLSQRARADAATGALDIAGDSVTTDNGQLQGLQCTLSDGHVSYNGLDTLADAVSVRFFAALAGGDTDASGNQIASQSFVVADESGLDTHAGSTDVSFTNVNVLAAQDINKADFKATTDGETKDTSIDFRLEVVVKDADENTLVETEDTTTATISVTNEPKRTGVRGSGGTSATGSNQNP